MSFNIEKWIEENSYQKSCAYNAQYVVDVEDLRELLKTHTIVPREPTDEMAMIKVAKCQESQS